MSIGRYKSYNLLQGSWLNECPAHWSYYPIKRIIDSCVNGLWGDEPDGGDGDVVVIRVADFDRSKFIVTDEKLTYRSLKESEISSRLVSKGDLLIEKSGGGEKTLVGQVVVFDGDFRAICSNFVGRVKLKRLNNPRYVCYLFSTLYDRNLNYKSIKQNTGIQNLDVDAYFMEGVPVAPHLEQLAIAAFLDRETAKIDELIAEQEKLIELLKEKRQAVISHAVTKGLDPNVKMKDSGVEWIGEVPIAWRVCGLGYISKLATGGTPDRTNDLYWNGDIPWIKTGEVNYETINGAEEQITHAGLHNSAAFMAEPGTILMAMYGMGVTRGRVAVLGINAAFNQACTAICCGQDAYNWYVYYCLVAAYKSIRELGNEASQVNLNLDVIAKIKIPVPGSIEEQRRIVESVEHQVQRIADLQNEASMSMHLLKERRSALISAAVTGKIDVRSLVTQDEIEAQRLKEAV